MVALDLEGTLISNAMSQFPRKGLHHFLELCGKHLPEVVLYTAVRRPLARTIVHTLVKDGLVPDWFKDIEYIDWSGAHKDLNFIGGHEPQQSLLVDDNEGYIEPTQREQWVSIEEFAHPYADDHELQRVWSVLNQRLRLEAQW